jgi:hypothetical protein
MIAHVGSARRHLLDRATTVAITFRHSVNAVVSIVVWVDPCVSQMAIRAGAAGFGCWALYRLLTRSSSTLLCGVDYCLTIAICVALPTFVCGPDFYRSNSAPVAIAGTAVISFAVSLPARVSSTMTAGIAAAFACGAAQVIGWPNLVAVFNLYYFAAQWAVSAAIRAMILRVADAVDQSSSQREAAEIDQQVLCAVRDYDHEQLRLLHDTVASTLMMVSDGVPIPRHRLAAQARRDLAIIQQRGETPTHLDVVDLLRDNGTYVRTPVRYSGLGRLLLDGKIAEAVAAAAREALNNVDRHAHAGAVLIDVQPDHLLISDDGCGFDYDSAVRGHGIDASILTRMESVGGAARVASEPGAGTRVELHWAPVQQSPTPYVDPDRLIFRLRASYGIALTAYAIINLALMAPAAFNANDRRGAQVALALAAAAAALSAAPRIMGRRRCPLIPAVVTVFMVGLVQPIFLGDRELGTQAHWAQAAIGWCLLPLLLSIPARRGAALLIVCWLMPAIYLIARDPTAHIVANIGYGTGSILGVQLAALMFNDLMARAADSARSETSSRAHLLAAHRISTALQTEYRNRYARLLDRLRPLLQMLSHSAPVDSSVRQEIQNEYRNLRALFDQAATFDHPLLTHIRPLIDRAEYRGVDVALQVESKLPVTSDDTAADIANMIDIVLSAATTSARITLSPTPSGIETSVLAGGLVGRASLVKLTEICDSHAMLTFVGDTAWFTMKYKSEGDGHPNTAGPRIVDRSHR